MHRLKRYLLITIGTICVALGVIGIVLPLLPTTPFLVLAASLYARSSQRFHDWLLDRKHLGEYIRAYREGRGMSAEAKASSLMLLWITLGSSALFAVQTAPVRLVLIAIGLGVTSHLLWIPTYGRIAVLEQARSIVARRHYCMDLASRTALLADLVGGKAASLSWIMHEGFDIPCGFAITPKAHEDHLSRLEHSRRLSTSRELDGAELARQITAAPLPPGVESHILRHYHLLGGEVAVRSSATCEDTATASCAGLLYTELGVEGDAAVLEAVKRCWASLYGEGMRSYLRQRADQQDVDLEHPCMGVVVQRMVSPLVAGVAFTADPSSGARHLVIEYAQGLGSLVVSGHVTPERYVLEPNGTIIRTPEEGSSALPRNVLEQLSEIAWHIEERKGSPQDIEWAWDGQRIWLLQCRPITTLDGSCVFTSRLAAEMSPGIIKPLVWSVNTSRVPATFDRAFVALTGHHEPECYRMITLLHSRLYLDIGVFSSLLDRLGMPPNMVRGLLYGYPPGKRHRRGLPFTGRSLRRLPCTVRFMWLVTRARESFQSFLSDHEAALKPLRDADLSHLSASELLCATDDLMHIHADAQWFTKIAALNLMLRNALLIRVVLRCAPAVDPADLLQGLGREGSVQSGIRLRALSRIAAELGSDERRLMLTASELEIRSALTASETGTRLLAEVDAYLADYGFLNSNGTDFSRTPWIEQPIVIWRAIGRGVDSSPAPDQRNPEAVRRLAQEQLLQAKGPMVRSFLVRVMESTRCYLWLKERCSLLMSEDSYHMHRIAVRMGHYLHELGALEQAEDVFYLSIDEIRQVSTGEMSSEQACSVSACRRAQLDADALVDPPEVIYGEWRPMWMAPASTKVGELCGIGASPGRVEGRARIVLDPSAVPMDVTPADILVVPFTDVGWMPLFSGIGGIVTERGGQLSHSAIVARELGLPAVLGVERATRLIRDGQRISIDGLQGIVHLAEGEAS